MESQQYILLLSTCTLSYQFPKCSIDMGQSHLTVWYISVPLPSILTFLFVNKQNLNSSCQLCVAKETLTGKQLIMVINLFTYLIFWMFFDYFELFVQKKINASKSSLSDYHRNCSFQSTVLPTHFQKLSLLNRKIYLKFLLT